MHQDGFRGEKENFHQPKLFANYLPNSTEGKYEKGENIKQKDLIYSMDGMFSQPQREVFVREGKDPVKAFPTGFSIPGPFPAEVLKKEKS